MNSYAGSEALPSLTTHSTEVWKGTLPGTLLNLIIIPLLILVERAQCALALGVFRFFVIGSASLSFYCTYSVRWTWFSLLAKTR